MLKPEYGDIFQALYDRAEELNPEIKNVPILYNTNSEKGVEIGKGTQEDEGTYRISCEKNDSNPDYTISSFALGLALVIYDVKYGEYDYNNMTAAERARFDTIFHEFFHESVSIENIEIQ